MTALNKSQHGDTIIEVMISLAIFSAVAMSTINMMNSGLNIAQRSLEMTMARQTISSQADALEFIHDSAVAESRIGAKRSKYLEIWKKIINNKALDPATMSLDLDINNAATCTDAINSRSGGSGKSFAINTRAIAPVYYDQEKGVEFFGDGTDDGLYDEIIIEHGYIQKGGLFPRILYREYGTNSISDLMDNTLIEDAQVFYRTAERAENFWITAVKGEDDYYDFYIQSCWNPAGAKNFVTFSTVKRIYVGGEL